MTRASGRSFSSGRFARLRARRQSVLDAVRGDLGLGEPSEGVEDGFAEVVVAPVVVEMAAGEAHAAAARTRFTAARRNAHSTIEQQLASCRAELAAAGRDLLFERDTAGRATTKRGGGEVAIG